MNGTMSDVSRHPRVLSASMSVVRSRASALARESSSPALAFASERADESEAETASASACSRARRAARGAVRMHVHDALRRLATVAVDLHLAGASRVAPNRRVDEDLARLPRRRAAGAAVVTQAAVQQRDKYGRTPTEYAELSYTGRDPRSRREREAVLRLLRGSAFDRRNRRLG